ncbi:MAG: hypothetical protein QG602_1898 [Verrucomicrobiota bacterium]|nr:hypothetical protein [Verrucomicrobiota bacterium]
MNPSCAMTLLNPPSIQLPALPFRQLLAVLLLGLACLPASSRAAAISRAISTGIRTQPPQVLAAWRTDNDGAQPAAARLPEAWAALAGAGAGRKRLEIKYPAPGLDLSGYAEVAVPVRNTGAKPLRVWLRVLTPDSGEKTESPRTGRTHEAVVPPTATPVWLFVTLAGDEAAPYFRKFIAFRQAPADFVRPGVLPDDHIAPGPPKGAAITGVVVGLADPEEAGSVEVGPAVARGTPVPLRDLPEDKAFPLFDAFGQYAHRDWPGKILAAADFAHAEHQEELDLLANPRPVDWNEFGGWTSGPQLAATGYFRTEKIDGQWWLVDPAGRLFWSHGIVRVGTRIRVGGVYHGTPILNREHLFRLPPRDSDLGRFYGSEPASTRFYYSKYPDHPVYDFLEANLFRKYGPDWASRYAEKSQRRLASWGLNTIANSSDPQIYLRRQTPYTAIVYSAPLGSNEHRIEGSTGTWGKLPDPYDPGWRRLIETTLKTSLRDSVGDPWCLGFFVDNELAWGDTFHLAKCVLRSPATQPAKLAFRDVLRAKYEHIGRLNAAWGMAHSSWEAFLEATTIPDEARSAAAEDLRDFSRAVIETYFKGCHDVLADIAPHQLYLGARFAGFNPLVLAVAAKYCDVLSLNRYYVSVAKLTLGETPVDRPILIGEFHFGALDRGSFSSALAPVMDQAARAIAYQEYVGSALRNPAIVGTHWFQFYDQPPSGRFDTENYQTGFVDIADTPYEETVAAARAMARQLYSRRHTSR